MSAGEWIALAGLIATFLGAPLFLFLRSLEKRISTIQDNHLNHIELYLRLLCEKLGVTYHEPKDRD